MCIEIFEFELTVAADGTASVTSDAAYYGEIIRVELYSADSLANNGTIKGYEAGALTAVGSRQDFLNVTCAGSAVSKEVLPTIQRTDITGTAVASEYAPPVVAGKLTIAMAAHTETHVLNGRVYVKG